MAHWHRYWFITVFKDIQKGLETWICLAHIPTDHLGHLGPQNIGQVSPKSLANQKPFYIIVRGGTGTWLALRSRMFVYQFLNLWQWSFKNGLINTCESSASSKWVFIPCLIHSSLRKYHKLWKNICHFYANSIYFRNINMKISAGSARRKSSCKTP